MSYAATRIYNANVPTANATNTLYTVPTGQTLILTNISIAAANGDIGAFNLYLGDNDGTGGWGGLVNYDSGLAQYEQRIFHGMYVVNAGGLINHYATTGNLNTWIQATGLLGTGTFEGGTPWKLSQNVVATGDIVAYTVPTGRTLIIKTMVVANPGVLNTAAVRIAGAPVAPYFATYTTGQMRQVDGSFIANAGDNITLNITTAPAVGSPGVTFYLNGVLY